jgi:hypothetical protein
MNLFKKAVLVDGCVVQLWMGYDIIMNHKSKRTDVTNIRQVGLSWSRADIRTEYLQNVS